MTADPTRSKIRKRPDERRTRGKGATQTLSKETTTTTTTEIAPDIFRICMYFPEWKLQFNQFLVRDNGPLLSHTGMRMLFLAVREAVASLVDPALQPPVSSLA